MKKLILTGIFLMLGIFSSLPAFTPDSGNFLLAPNQSLRFFYGDFTGGASMDTLSDLSEYLKQFNNTNYDILAVEYPTGLAGAKMGFYDHGFDIFLNYHTTARQKDLGGSRENRRSVNTGNLVLSRQFMLLRDLYSGVRVESFFLDEKTTIGEKSILVNSVYSFISGEEYKVQKNGLLVSSGVLYQYHHLGMGVYAGPSYHYQDETSTGEWKAHYHGKIYLENYAVLAGRPLWMKPYLELRENYYSQNAGGGLAFFFHRDLEFDLFYGYRESHARITYQFLPFSSVYLKASHETDYSNTVFQMGLVIKFSGFGFPDMVFPETTFPEETAKKN